MTGGSIQDSIMIGNKQGKHQSSQHVVGVKSLMPAEQDNAKMLRYRRSPGRLSLTKAKAAHRSHKATTLWALIIEEILVIREDDESKRDQDAHD